MALYVSHAMGPSWAGVVRDIVGGAVAFLVIQRVISLVSPILDALEPLDLLFEILHLFF
jgi:hypothetical protein